MSKKRILFSILLTGGLLCAGLAAPQGNSVKCRKCTRFPGTSCWPESDWTDLADPGCITDSYEPCIPNLGRRYTITWTGQSIMAMPEERILWCRGAAGSYQVCHPGNVLYSYSRGCPPVFYPPISARGSFVAEASRATASSVLLRWCGASGETAILPDNVRIGLFIPYYAAVSCGDSFDHSSRIEVTRNCG